jgi:hypothetical protein
MGCLINAIRRDLPKMAIAKGALIAHSSLTALAPKAPFPKGKAGMPFATYLEGERPQDGNLKPFQVRLYKLGVRVKHPSSDAGDEALDVVDR